MAIELLTTTGCHLCEKAELLVAMVDPGLALAKVDIAESDALIARYGERIPVLRDGQRELGWPFGLLDVQRFLSD